MEYLIAQLPYSQLITQQLPLLLVVCSLLCIAFCAYFVNQYSDRHEFHLLLQQSVKQQNATQSRQNTADTLSLLGLNQQQVEHVRHLAAKKNMLQLSVFLAKHQISIPEIKQLLPEIEPIIDEPWLQQDPDQELPRQNPDILRHLNQQELRSIYEVENNPHRLIDAEFITNFGNLLFMENFIIFKHLIKTGSNVFYIPKNDKLRFLFNAFVKSGIAIQGKAIPIEQRLNILNLQELQTMAQELNMSIQFESMDQAIQALANNPMVTVRLAAKFSTDDLFMLEKKQWDTIKVEHEWAAYNAYAKLICNKPEAATTA